MLSGVSSTEAVKLLVPDISVSSTEAVVLLVAALSLPPCLAVASAASTARVEAREGRFVVVGRDSSAAPQASSSSSFVLS